MLPCSKRGYKMPENDFVDSSRLLVTLVSCGGCRIHLSRYDMRVELEDPLENVGVKLVRQAGAKTNDLAGDGSRTSIVLAGLIVEGSKVIEAGMNPVQIAHGIEKTAKALVEELRKTSRDVKDDELADVAAVSAGKDYLAGNMVSDAIRQLGRGGVITTEKGRKRPDFTLRLLCAMGDSKT